MTAEEQLVLNAKQFNPEAWTQIYDRDYRTIYSFIYRRVGASALAEDLTSGVFLKAVEGIAKFKYRGTSLTAWLLTIGRNLVADHYRRMSGSPEQTLPLDRASEGPSPEQLAEATLQREELYRALDHLTEEQKQVVTLRFIDGLSTAEVSYLLDREEGAIRALQHRAVASLRRIMAEDAVNEK